MDVNNMSKIPGSILSDRQIREAVYAKEIIIKVPIRDLDNPKPEALNEYHDALVINTQGRPDPKLLDSVGYQLLPGWYYIRRKWKPIPQKGYKLKAGRSVIIQSRQLIGLNKYFL